MPTQTETQTRRYEITLEAQENAAGKWFATATTNGGQANGHGSSCDVACFRATQNLVQALEASSVEPAAVEAAVNQANEGRRFYISAGRRGGQMCTFIRVLAVLQDSEVWEVRYQDGTTGQEKARFLQPTV